MIRLPRRGMFEAPAAALHARFLRPRLMESWDWNSRISYRCLNGDVCYAVSREPTFHCDLTALLYDTPARRNGEMYRGSSVMKLGCTDYATPTPHENSCYPCPKLYRINLPHSIPRYRWKFKFQHFYPVTFWFPSPRPIPTSLILSLIKSIGREGATLIEWSTFFLMLGVYREYFTDLSIYFLKQVYEATETRMNK